MNDLWRQGGFGLYVHWPFCQSKCPYCDFNSHVSASISQNLWAEAYEAQIALYGAELPGRVLNSIYFGGGTPSLMAPETVHRVVEAARRAWPFANDIEITLEANPTSVEAGRFTGFRDAGVNRVSMGIQSLINEDLRKLGRLHSAEEARAAFATARAIFDRVSFDLIYARQHQSLDDWRVELSDALDMAADHLSLYQLTIEDGTAFGDRFARGGLRGLPGEDLAADMYDLTQELTSQAGFAAYEVSNHARPGHESKHNLIYWSAGDYVGIGPGAHGRITTPQGRFATETPLIPTEWLVAARAGKSESARERLSVEDQATEMLLMGLRQSNGVDLTKLLSLCDLNISNNIKYLEDISLIESVSNHLRTTQKGRPLLNSILAKLLA